MKNSPKKIVESILMDAFLLVIISWWARVTAPPLSSNTQVFNKGTLNGSILTSENGGQTVPISLDGTKLL